MGKLVCGVGLYEPGEYVSAVGHVRQQEYTLWTNMLRRCYNKKSVEKNPAYAGCSVSPEFLNFQSFAKWVSAQHGYGLPGWELEKDILVTGNRVYSPQTCVLVPIEVNLLFTRRKAKRGAYPIGVHFHKPRNKFLAQIALGDVKRKYLGLFDTPEQAFEAYKVAKEVFIKQRANEFKELLDTRVYDALMAYEVSITE